MYASHDQKKQKGAALIIVIFFFIAISLAVIQSATIGAIVELRTYRTLATSKAAYVAAEAGVEDIFYRTITDKLIPSSQVLTLGNASTTVNVVSVSPTQSDVYANGVSNTQVRKLYVSLRKNVSVEFPYGAQVGEGGITMSNNVIIDGTGLNNADVYANGQIVGATSVSITGNAISSSGMSADPTASSTSCTNDEIVGRTDPNIDFAQSFIIGTSSSVVLSKVSLYIKRNGNATGANIRITADGGGKPATTALATQALSYSIVSTNYGWVDIIFSSPVTLSPATTYWIVFDATQSSSKYWYWCRSGASTYDSGVPLYKQDWSTAGAWTSVTGDMAFTLTYGSGVSQISDVEISGTAKADTITSSTIGGDAYYQTISGSTVTGTSYSGSPTPPYVPLPISTTTLAQWKSDAASGGTITGNCGTGGVSGCNTSPLAIGPKKIDGNLLLDIGQALTINGTVYVTGSVMIENNTTVRCAFEYLGNSCVLLADGPITVRNNAAFDGSGTSGSYVMLLSTKTGCLISSGSGCATNNSAISLENNIDGALFYTTDSAINISNNAIVTAVVGYMLNLTNNAQIIYNPLVASLSFAASATSTTGAWNANRWNEF